MVPGTSRWWEICNWRSGEQDHSSSGLTQGVCSTMEHPSTAACQSGASSRPTTPMCCPTHHTARTSTLQTTGSSLAWSPRSGVNASGMLFSYRTLWTMNSVKSLRKNGLMQWINLCQDWGDASRLMVPTLRGNRHWHFGGELTSSSWTFFKFEICDKVAHTHVVLTAKSEDTHIMLTSIFPWPNYSKLMRLHKCGGQRMFFVVCKNLGNPSTQTGDRLYRRMRTFKNTNLVQ